ncbi:MAG: AAA family ATPase [Deltaproteobacteria bacterium]|nr:AAA family ATPase [Deltaproteobacteria bacterium]MBW2071599.1 AAA family ATPase [Deltaproteobacteria bacterium]
MSDGEYKVPDQKELEKELSEYLSKKYGGRIKIVSPMMVPKPARETTEEEGGKGDVVNKIHFDMKPEELESYLNEYVIKQDEAKAILATKVCTHFNRIKHELRSKRRADQTDVGRIKNNIILIGPTGVGKTYIVKLIAKKLGVPFVKGDATKFSETGYVGGDVEDLVRDLVHEANDDIELAQYGIIYIDEIDKIASTPNLIGPDVSRTGVQRALLKPMEETEVDLKVPHDPISQIQAIEQYRKTGKREKRVINTRNILFIVSGAFNELTDIVKKRLKKQGIGFGAELASRDEQEYYLKLVKAEDLIQYGFESEFVGRLPVVAVLEELSADDLYQILKNPKNPVINAKKADFRAYGIDIRFEDEALRLLAARAYEERTGARGLVSVLEKVVIPFEKKLPSTDINFFLVTPEVVENPQKILADILANPDDPQLWQRYQEAFERDKAAAAQSIEDRRDYYRRRFEDAFTEERLDMIVSWHLRSGTEIDDLFQDVVSLIGEVRSFEQEFLRKHRIRIHFSEDAVNEILRRAVDEETSADAICRKISSDYDYALKLVMDKTGQQEFIITAEAVQDPETFINEMIRSSYRDGSLLVPRGSQRD